MFLMDLFGIKFQAEETFHQGYMITLEKSQSWNSNINTVQILAKSTCLKALII